ncbi:MAG TPA: hypothetical protein VHN37_14845 [Actinomycetota bacterium]|nr:hypothetical protein [Actinomycetota bacterium]
MWSSPRWNGPDLAVRVELAEIMDDLDPGWSAWRQPSERGVERAGR